VNELPEVLQSACSPEQLLPESETKLPDARKAASRIEAAVRGPMPLALGTKESAPVKAVRTILRCECFHAKSIHSRMYANRSLGTACNFPECRCKAYRPAKAKGRKKSKR
jgi:hypothetical protein